MEHLHDDQAVLVVDETGDVKKAAHTVGVQRQYTGTTGRVENASVAVCLVYAGRRGHGAVDRELYVPRPWTSDSNRCRAAGLAEDTSFATKPELAARIVARFLDSGHPDAWVVGDEVYGGNPKLRTALEERRIGYVLAVACSHEATASAGKFRADALAEKVPERAWQKLSAGAAAEGPPLLRLGRHRSGRSPPRKSAAGPPQPQQPRTRLLPLLLAERVRVAGSRWRVEEVFQFGKGLAALDEHQVRRYTFWSRWVTLASSVHPRHAGRTPLYA
ncbi:IS701 family transposase [Streptomyces sp. NBC_01433]|uniref:IS701 family transposase n=1 Tax=Streptomyces sp. NBC_01433 TaxID=2903864 RepID=UPI0022532583|nr:IS701 family transposase [Streptomyces sp. NBC_01433]MCX4681916.1 IS701 family transposase [Streptomyces sp. NBC_01433]